MDRTAAIARFASLRLAVLAAFLCLFPLCFAGQSVAGEKLDPSVRFEKLVIEKQKRLLTAYAQGKPVRVYRVALGGNPVGPKRIEGDQKTPEGTYRVDGKNPHSRYYKNLGVSYPDAADKKRAAALGKSPGGDIKIHGLGPEFRHLGKEQWRHDWTLGCIAVTDEEIDELYAHTNVGAAIVILP